MEICFIQTGGTIDKDYPRLTLGYAFEITSPAVERILAQVDPNVKTEVIPLLQKDSQDMLEEDRQLIFKTCLKTNASKIVITHGTDTMIETANYLGTIPNKVVVLTGSMRPERFNNSDAAFNIGVAVGALNVLQEGVYVAMNGRVYPSNKVVRDLTTGQFVGKKL